MRQKRILSIAAEDPDASLEEIATEVATATADDVERVLAEYGDPAEEAPGDGQPNGTPASSDGGKPPTGGQAPSIESTVDEQPSSSQLTDSEHHSETATDQHADTPTDQQPDSEATPQEPDTVDTDAVLGSLTPKQQETLAAIRANPEATQRELADVLDVSAPTVSNRVNAIPEFQWADRLSFIENIIETADSGTIEALEPTQQVSAQTDSESKNESSEPKTSEPESSETGSSGDESNRAGSTAAAADAAEAAGDETTNSESDSDSESAAADETEDSKQTTDSDAETTGEPAKTQSAQLETLAHHLEDLNDRLAAMENESTGNVFEDSELVHKVIHACMGADTISEDEELEIIKQLT